MSSIDTSNFTSFTDILSLILAGIAIIVTVIIGIYQYKISKRQISIEERVKRFDNQEGEVVLVTILIRYFMTFTKAWDSGARLKTDIVSVHQHFNEVNDISKDLHNLINNPFFIKLIEKYPEIIIYSTTLKRTLVEQRIIIENDISKFSLNSSTFMNFKKILFILMKSKTETDIFEKEAVKDIVTLVNEFVDLNPQLKG